MTKKEYENVMSQMSFPFRSVIVFKLPKLTNTDEKYIFAKKKIEMVSRVLMSVFFLTFTVIFVLLYFYPFLGKSGE